MGTLDRRLREADPLRGELPDAVTPPPLVWSTAEVVFEGRRYGSRRQWVGALIVAAAVSLVVVLLAGGLKPASSERSAAGMEQFTVPSSSMAPTLRAGQQVSVDVDAYKSEDPKVGDIVVFHPPIEATREGVDVCTAVHDAKQACPQPGSRPSDLSFAQRIVAIPGDRLYHLDGLLVRNGEPLEFGNEGPCSQQAYCLLREPITVPAGTYVVLGDNRGHSLDSRSFGPIPKDWIVGKVQTDETTSAANLGPATEMPAGAEAMPTQTVVVHSGGGKTTTTVEPANMPMVSGGSVTRVDGVVQPEPKPDPVAAVDPALQVEALRSAPPAQLDDHERGEMGDFDQTINLDLARTLRDTTDVSVIAAPSKNGLCILIRVPRYDERAGDGGCYTTDSVNRGAANLEAHCWNDIKRSIVTTGVAPDGFTTAQFLLSGKVVDSTDITGNAYVLRAPDGADQLRLSGPGRVLAGPLRDAESC